MLGVTIMRARAEPFKAIHDGCGGSRSRVLCFERACPNWGESARTQSSTAIALGKLPSEKEVNKEK